MRHRTAKGVRWLKNTTVRAVLSCKDSNFEKALWDFYRSAERTGDRWSLDIPTYGNYFGPSATSTSKAVRNTTRSYSAWVLGSSFEMIMFLNLNYDLFIERALRNRNRHSLDTLRSYVPANKKWLLIKSAGAVNWAKVLENWPRHTSGDLMAFASEIEDAPRFGSEIEVLLRST